MAGRHRLWEFYYNGTDERAFFILFVVAGLFPFSAIAYRIFQRDTQLAELQKEFELLGIVKHESSTSDSSGQEYVLLRYTQSYGLWNFAIQSMFAVYLTAIGLSLFFWPPQIDGNHLLDANTLQAMRYGFLGAYIYSLQLIYRRYTTLDLQPTVYMNCTLTMISGLAFNYVAFQAISKLSATPNANQVATGAEAGLVAIVAFSLGYFPYLALGWFNRLAHTAIGVRQRRSDALQLELIDGISQLHETRLRDEGIENIQNLAAAPIDQLIVNTRFSAQQVIEWIDQAILYLERSV